MNSEINIWLSFIFNLDDSFPLFAYHSIFGITVHAQYLTTSGKEILDKNGIHNSATRGWSWEVGCYKNLT